MRTFFGPILVPCRPRGHAGARYVGGHGPLSGLAATTWLRDGNMAWCCLVMSLPLEFSALWRTLKRTRGAVARNNGHYILAPMAAVGLAPLLGEGIRSGPARRRRHALHDGLGRGVDTEGRWQRRGVAGRHRAITNIVCFLVTPTLLVWTAGEAARGVSIPVAPLMKD